MELIFDHCTRSMESSLEAEDLQHRTLPCGQFSVPDGSDGNSFGQVNSKVKNNGQQIANAHPERARAPRSRPQDIQNAPNVTLRKSLGLLKFTPTQPERKPSLPRPGLKGDPHQAQHGRQEIPRQCRQTLRLHVASRSSVRQRIPYKAPLKGREPGHHRIEKAARRPQVCRQSVPRPLNFWGHVVGGTTDRVSLVVVVSAREKHVGLHGDEGRGSGERGMKNLVSAIDRWLTTKRSRKT